MIKKKLPLLSLVLLLFSCTTQRSSTALPDEVSQARDSYERYVLTYYPLAVEQMEKYRIPASITLAQGLLESGAGNSELTKKSNNHFGIKADKSWKGEKTTSFDNGRTCYFRVYDHPRGSYEDHSLFLTGRSRYSSLFELKITDYEGWAKGLKKAGYAEDPAYPQKLISLIERYNLDKYDRYSTKKVAKELPAQQLSGVSMRAVYKSNDLYYVVADDGDTFASLAKETGVSRRKLIKYNDLYKNYKIQAGDIIYLQKKNSKAKRPYYFHKTLPGDCLHSISQKYGVRLSKIMKMNPQYKEFVELRVGDAVRLR